MSFLILCVSDPRTNLQLLRTQTQTLLTLMRLGARVHRVLSPRHPKPPSRPHIQVEHAPFTCRDLFLSRTHFLSLLHAHISSLTPTCHAFCVRFVCVVYVRTQISICVCLSMSLTSHHPGPWLHSAPFSSSLSLALYLLADCSRHTHSLTGSFPQGN